MNFIMDQLSDRIGNEGIIAVIGFEISDDKV